MATALGEEPSEDVRALVMQAYEAPREKTEEARLWAAAKFGDEANIDCYRLEIEERR